MMNLTRPDVNGFSSQDYHLQTHSTIQPYVPERGGAIHIVNKNNFPKLEGVTCHTLELWEQSMQLPHWHPNASELGYVISGKIEVLLWRSTGESAVFTVGPGMCWFIPKGAFHCLNNVSTERTKLILAYSSDSPQEMDLPVAFNGLPPRIRDAYTAPHMQLREWEGMTSNPVLGSYPEQSPIHTGVTGSPYGLDFAKMSPLFHDIDLGSIAWGIKNNWSILEDISVLHVLLKSGVARDPIWYPDAGTLYVVTKGHGEFNLIFPEQEPNKLEVKQYDYIFVPMGTLHTFSNTSAEDFEVIAFFNKADPRTEISLSVASGFLPNTIRRAAMTQYTSENKNGDPLKELNFTDVNPYLLRIADSQQIKIGAKIHEQHKMMT